MHAIVRHGLN